MKINILGEYNTYITIEDKFNKRLYNGNVFELVELKSNQIKLFFNSIKYNVYNIDSEFFLLIGYKSYHMINKKNLEKILMYSYKDVDINNIDKITLKQFLLIYFKKSSFDLEIYFETNTTIDDEFNFMLSKHFSELHNVYIIFDDHELNFKYDSNNIIMLDFSKLL